jgi:5-methyltetrahydrofolate--homocysteine methyltransferase
MGVMVATADILQKAKDENVDIIGLSGLITPSLDEMVGVAKEMQRQGFTIPLLIGGATTSKVHTAVKIEPQYEGAAIYVPDASRAVGVASKLLSKEKKVDYVDSIKQEYETLRVKRASNQRVKKTSSLIEARDNAVAIDWANYQPPQPVIYHTTPNDIPDYLQIEHKHGGVILQVDHYPLEELLERIDWTPFFRSWELAGRYPAILKDEVVGEEATKLFADAKVMLRQIVAEKWLTAKAVVGFFPANRTGADDIELYSDNQRDEVQMTLHHLRQQMARNKRQPNFCLSDFIAPKATGKTDWIGAFASTTGIGIEARLAAYKADLDDYNMILLEALADRLAEAFAECLHEKVRTEYWGYAQDEDLSNQEIITEKYQGIRPAPGYPACPDHTEKGLLWQLLEPDTRIGLSLTESYAMWPAAAVSGWYFSHPNTRYFGTGKIQKDQVVDYAKRKGWDLDKAEKWLMPVLAYDA